MTQYKTLNVKLSNLQLNQLKSGTKIGTEVTSKTSSNVVGDSNDKNNFPRKLLLTNTQVSKLCKASANNSSANMKLSKKKCLDLVCVLTILMKIVKYLKESGLLIKSVSETIKNEAKEQNGGYLGMLWCTL